MKSFRMYLIERLYRSELKHRIAHLDDEQTKEAVKELCAADLKRKIAHLSFERTRDKIDDDLPEIIEKDITRIGFASLIDLADKTTTNCPLEEQISFYDYLINIVLSDACAQQSLRPLISGGYGKPILNGFLDKYYDEKEGCGISAFVDENRLEINVSETHVYVCPHSVKKRIGALMDLKKAPLYLKHEEDCACYYPDLNLCYVYNRNHHIHAADYYNKGTIPCYVCKTELLYQHVNTDGYYWYGISKDGRKTNTMDFRLATAYALAQKRYFLKKSAEAQQKNV